MKNVYYLIEAGLLQALRIIIDNLDSHNMSKIEHHNMTMALQNLEPLTPAKPTEKSEEEPAEDKK